VTVKPVVWMPNPPHIIHAGLGNDLVSVTCFLSPHAVMTTTYYNVSKI
jgi:hypothetical protein